ncbi:MAG: hypothetical protein Q4G33_14330 [bacterium]|nr:hypothetical protein [bacterium]
MSDIKERILGAVTVMSEQDAGTLWKIIINNFSSWDGIDEIDPDEIDKKLLAEATSDSECHEFISEAEAMRELGLA